MLLLLIFKNSSRLKDSNNIWSISSNLLADTYVTPYLVNFVLIPLLFSLLKITFPKLYVFPCVLSAVKQYAKANEKPVLSIFIYFPLIFTDELLLVGLIGNILVSSVNKDLPV